MSYKTLKHYMSFCRKNNIRPDFNGLLRYKEYEQDIYRDTKKSA